MVLCFVLVRVRFGIEDMFEERIISDFQSPFPHTEAQESFLLRWGKRLKNGIGAWVALDLKQDIRAKPWISEHLGEWLYLRKDQRGMIQLQHKNSPLSVMLRLVGDSWWGTEDPADDLRNILMV